MNYRNKVVVITGASSGIGKAASIKFAKKNANTSMLRIISTFSRFILNMLYKMVVKKLLD
jgi:NAD(P)-dependent dehydrogenase (short-subunit alcohol dehydrogenase family)